MTQYDLVGIGNAVVDVISKADDNFLELMGIEKGIMQLVERERGELGELCSAVLHESLQARRGRTRRATAATR